MTKIDAYNSFNFRHPGLHFSKDQMTGVLNDRAHWLSHVQAYMVRTLTQKSLNNQDHFCIKM